MKRIALVVLSILAALVLFTEPSMAQETNPGSILEMIKEVKTVNWFTLSVIISCIAQAFNRDGFGWWIAGLGLGPIALVILALSGKKEPKTKTS